MKKLRSIQVLRGVAAIGVVILHANLASIEANPARWGGAGVDLFFVISGFIMASIGQDQAPGHFLRNRIGRIYPLWLLAMLPWFLVNPADWQTVAASFTLWPAYDRLVLPVLELGWTLSFEMLFYLAFAVALRTGAGLPIAVFATAAILTRFTEIPVIEFVGNPIIFEFLLGVLVARSRLQSSARLNVLIGAAGLVLFALSPGELYNGAIARDADSAMFRVAFWGLPAAMIVYSAVGLEHCFGTKSWNIPVFFGDASYSIYLFHPVALYMFPNLPWFETTVLAVGSSIMLYVVIEKGLLERLRRWRRDRPSLAEKVPGWTS